MIVKKKKLCFTGVLGIAKQSAVVLSGCPKASNFVLKEVFLMDTAHCVLSISDYDFWLYIKLIKQLTVKKN